MPEDPYGTETAYYECVVAEVLRQTGWSEPEVRAFCGTPVDTAEGLDDGLSASDYVSELFHAAAS